MEKQRICCNSQREARFATHFGCPWRGVLEARRTGTCRANGKSEEAPDRDPGPLLSVFGEVKPASRGCGRDDGRDLLPLPVSLPAFR